LNATSALTSSCSSSTEDAKLVKDILISMGYDPSKAFSSYEPCEQPFDFEDYCKFSSGIQVFFS
jgi:hypothetical protein